MSVTSPLTIGITGGIGSGKSTIARVLESMGFPIYYADSRAKNLMHENKELVKGITFLFGEQAYINGELNRPFIAEQVFSNKEKLNALNALVHPAVGKDFDDWTSKQITPFVFKEAAILFEIGSHEHMDYNILVTAPIQERIRRTIARDKTTEQAVRHRMKNQWTDEKKIPLANFVIDNGGTVLVIPQMLEVVRELKMI